VKPEKIDENDPATAQLANAVKAVNDKTLAINRYSASNDFFTITRRRVTVCRYIG
jgi:hypothetical protein